MQRKFIVVTGGVLSGLGKGIAMASIGRILASCYKVVPVKCDGYLNVDPGTMNPIEHGEVFVLDDGGEVDMDFGHYERFFGVSCRSDFGLTMGKVFNEIRKKERRGDYLGKTVEYIPHVVDFIKNYYQEVGEKEDADVVLVEIGGTVGQIENDLYIEACRQLKKDVGGENIAYVHLAYVPVIHGNEQKSKPIQQSVAKLREKGIQPDVIIGRCKEYLTDRLKGKIGVFCDVNNESVITGVDVDDVYKIPLVFEDQGMSQLLARRLNIPINSDLREWRRLVENKENLDKGVVVAIAGKYTELEDSYISIIESLKHCEANLGVRVDVKWIDTECDGCDSLEGVDAVIVPGGFGSRGIEGKIDVARFCRERGVPFLGICYGLQMAVIEFARNVCGLDGANTTEVNKDTPHPVVDIMESQKGVEDKGGTMRLGAYPAYIKEGSRVFELYGCDEVSERHRHRFEVNPAYHEALEAKGLVLSGMSPDRKLVEFIELPEKRFFVATQAHPELKSSLLKPAPLFRGLVEAAMKRKFG
jgi:CTP synthase